MSHCFLVKPAGIFLLEEALNLDPDFSEWSGKPREGDEDFGPAPELAGQYLAAKKALQVKKKSGHIPESGKHRATLVMSILVHHAELEFLEHIKGLGNEDRLRMRSSGRIVLVKNESDK